MNIFKVLASGKKSFQEETASAILAWFLNPTIEHGLGYSFLSRFIDDLFSSTDNKNKLSDLSKKLIPRLRSEDETQLKLWSDLEYNVEAAVIDIVIGIDDWIFAIENKIYTQSTTEDQLDREYKGLKQKVPDFKIGMIYLVPIDEKSEILDAKIENIFNELSVENSDFKAIVTWQKNEVGNIPSIADLIEKTLDDESKGIIDPIPEYTRHTLKALNSFISNNFAGYEYERKTMTSGLNPLTEERLSIDKLKFINKGYVGVQCGIRGLLKMEQGKIKNHKFQYTSQDMSKKRYWIEINTFQIIIRWILYHELQEIDWNGSFSSELLYKIANDYKGRVFIGIRGGEEALRNMETQVIKSKEWGISTEQSTPQWIDGTLFCDILKEKGAYQ
jgi:hypothetical protein